MERRRRAMRTIDAILGALPEDRDAVIARVRATRDWPALLDEACIQGVEGVIFWHLEQWGEPLPAAVRSSVEGRLLFERARAGRFEAALDEALRALEAAGVPCAPIKGPVLGERLYPHASLRRSSDVDIVVAWRDAGRALGALEALGYRDKVGLAARFERDRRGAAELNFELVRERSPLLELHFRLFAGFGAVVESSSFLDRSLPYTTKRGAGTRVLCAADELLYLAVHAAGSFFARASWLYDLKLLLAANPGLDGRAVLERARALGLGTAFEYACATLARRLSVRWARELVAAERIRFALASSLLGATATWRSGSRGARVAQVAFRALLSDRVGAVVARRAAARVGARTL